MKHAGKMACLTLLHELTFELVHEYSRIHLRSAWFWGFSCFGEQHHVWIASTTSFLRSEIDRTPTIFVESGDGHRGFRCGKARCILFKVKQRSVLADNIKKLWEVILDSVERDVEFLPDLYDSEHTWVRPDKPCKGYRWRFSNLNFDNKARINMCGSHLCYQDMHSMDPINYSNENCNSSISPIVATSGPLAFKVESSMKVFISHGMPTG